MIGRGHECVGVGLIQTEDAIAAQAGFDYDLSDTMFLNLDVRCADFDAEAEPDGVEPKQSRSTRQSTA